MEFVALMKKLKDADNFDLDIDGEDKEMEVSD